MSLVKHIRRECELAGVEPSVTRSLVKMGQTFSNMGHSGASAEFTIMLLHDLLQFKNISPLTDNPDEWMFHGPDIAGTPDGVWQNIRNGEAFSNDGGKTYTLLFEEDKPIHESKPHQPEPAIEVVADGEG